MIRRPPISTPFPAVSRELQLKCQDSGITFSNGNRVRGIDSPTTYTSKTCTGKSNHKNTGSPDGKRRGANAGGSRLRPPEFLLYLDGRTGVDELLLDGLGFVLADAFLDRLGRAIHQVKEGVSKDEAET